MTCKLLLYRYKMYYLPNEKYCKTKLISIVKWCIRSAIISREIRSSNLWSNNKWFKKMFEIRFVRNRFCKLQQILCLPINHTYTNTLIIYKCMTACNCRINLLLNFDCYVRRPGRTSMFQRCADFFFSTFPMCSIHIPNLLYI